MAEADLFPELAKFYFDEVVRRRRRLFTAVLERGIKDGEFRQVIRGVRRARVVRAAAVCRPWRIRPPSLSPPTSRGRIHQPSYRHHHAGHCRESEWERSDA